MSFEGPYLRKVSFRGCQSGSVSIIFGLLTLLLFGMLGASIDYSRWSNAKTRIAEGLDSAVLVAGRHLQMNPGDVEGAVQVANVYFNDIVASKLDLVNLTANFALTDNDTAIAGSVSGKIETPLLGIMNLHNLDLNADSKAMLATAGSGGSELEISLMLDVTGSMCDNGAGPCTSSAKLNALKAAAKDLVNIVIRDTGTTNARVALVPFSTRVRVGGWGGGLNANLMKPLTDLDPMWNGYYKYCTASTGGGGSEGGGNWSCTAYESRHVNWKVMPCVVDRTGPQQFTDALPGADAWLIAHGGSRFPLSNDSSNSPYSWGPLGTNVGSPADHWNYDSGGGCGDVADVNVIRSLSDDKVALMDHIDRLEAYGATGGALGTAWAWYMLSPNWNSIWTGQSQPGPYSDLTTLDSGGTPKLRKIAVLMTDGDYNTHRGWKDSDPVMVSNNAKAICANMKAAGVEVFTVGFDLDALSAEAKSRATATLSACGSDSSHFYQALNTDQLRVSFRDIAAKMLPLYLAK